jgi:hypothetical protein
MDTITLVLNREETTTVRFLLGGAAQNPSVSPPQRIAAQEVLNRVNEAIVAPEPSDPTPGPAPELTE